MPGLVASVVGTRSELVPLEVDLSAVAAFVGTVVFVAEIGVAAVAFGSDEIGGLNHSAMTRGMTVESFGS